MTELPDELEARPVDLPVVSSVVRQTVRGRLLNLSRGKYEEKSTLASYRACIWVQRSKKIKAMGTKIESVCLTKRVDANLEMAEVCLRRLLYQASVLTLKREANNNLFQYQAKVPCLLFALK